MFSGWTKQMHFCGNRKAKNSKRMHTSRHNLGGKYTSTLGSENSCLTHYCNKIYNMIFFAPFTQKSVFHENFIVSAQYMRLRKRKKSSFLFGWDILGVGGWSRHSARVHNREMAAVSPCPEPFRRAQTAAVAAVGIWCAPVSTMPGAAPVDMRAFFKGPIALLFTPHPCDTQEMGKINQSIK